jgi:hypothetical protein
LFFRIFDEIPIEIDNLGLSFDQLKLIG